MWIKCSSDFKVNYFKSKPERYHLPTTVKSPCPHNQMSIIILKRCPILRTFIHKIMSHCWRERIFPSCWKQAFTILIHKKGSNMESSNFRPITFQSIFVKDILRLFEMKFTTFFSKINLLSRTYRKVSGEQYQGQ